MCDHHHHHHEESASLSFLFSYTGPGFKIPEGKLLAIYSILLIASSTLEVVYGLYTSDSHVVTEGFHTFFHAISI